MLKFIKKIIMFTFIIVILLLGIVSFDYGVIGSQYKNNYNAALIDKVNRLIRINEPKIILVGNSNLAFGIDSEQIEKSIGMPVVNLGLHGGLGNAFHEEIAKLNIGSGDIVVVCHSDFSDDDTINNSELAWITYDYNSEIWPIIRKKDYKDMLIAYPTYLRKSYWLWITRKGNMDSGDCYSRNAFNEYGDVIYKPNEGASGQIDEEYFKENASAFPKISDSCVDRINELNQYCIGKGASLVVAGYPIERGAYNRYTEEEYILFQEELEDVLNCPVISDYTDYFFFYKYFYNGPLHLNEEGRQARTSQLILDIEKWLENNK